jgi:hypothetical protein
MTTSNPLAVDSMGVRHGEEETGEDRENEGAETVMEAYYREYGFEDSEDEIEYEERRLQDDDEEVEYYDDDY